jgi:hypothetical protein
MNLIWHVSEVILHVYFNILWENRYKISMPLVCDGFIARVSSLIFKNYFPRLSEAARKVISKTGHWYLEERNTYIKIFVSLGAPHLLPAHVLDKLVLWEIYYHTILQGFDASLLKDKKRIFNPYGFYLGYHFMKDTTQARQEAQIEIEHMFITKRYKRHDPRKLVVEHGN